MKRAQRGNGVSSLDRPYALWAVAIPRDIDSIDGLGGSEDSEISGGEVEGYAEMERRCLR